MSKEKVLFVCIHNSARSQMAEAFLKKYGSDRFEAESAGLEPGELNPIVVEAMDEAGIDISKNKTKSVFDMFKEGKLFQYVITVCDESQSEKCPIFPSTVERVHWSFPDPSVFQGTHDEKLKKTKEVRDQTESRIKAWLKTV